MYSGKSVSKVILNYCKKREIEISCVYLQLLLYLIQEYFCCFGEMSLINEKFRAYSFGPAIKEILDDFDDITKPVKYGKYRCEKNLPKEINDALVKYLDVHYGNQSNGNIFSLAMIVKKHKPYYETYNEYLLKKSEEKSSVFKEDKNKEKEFPIIPQQKILSYCKELIANSADRRDR